jgi:hypothetical protein
VCREAYLHFQIITDLMELGANFPGFCEWDEKDIWTIFSIDPNLILAIPEDIIQDQHLPKGETLKSRRTIIGKNLSLAYNTPLKIERGWMQYLYDETGRRYLDAYNNVPHVGHCHPRVVKEGHKQMSILNTNMRYLHD